jgi:ATP-dependent RNA helicase RhlE
MPRVLVFTRTKRGADKVVKGLVEGGGVAAAAIHGNKSTERSASARWPSFKSGEGAGVLVATDIAARGIDVSMACRTW